MFEFEYDRDKEVPMPEEFLANKEIDMSHIKDIVEFEKLASSDSKKAINRGLRASSERVGRIIQEEMSNLGVSQFAKDVSVKATAQEYSVEVADPQSVFVEFGTGIRGKKEPHPEASDYSWKYDINSHGESGWYAPLDKLDPNDYKIVKKGKPYGRTKGMPARPFFYNAVNRIRSTGIITRLIRKELRRFL